MIALWHAEALAVAGAKVCATGRMVAETAFSAPSIPIRSDHMDDRLTGTFRCMIIDRKCL